MGKLQRGMLGDNILVDCFSLQFVQLILISAATEFSTELNIATQTIYNFF